MSITSLTGTSRARRTMIATCTMIGAGTVLDITGAGKLVAIRGTTTSNTAIIQISIDNTETFQYGINSFTSILFNNLLDTASSNETSEVNISFTRRLTITTNAAVSIRFNYEAEV